MGTKATVRPRGTPSRANDTSSRPAAATVTFGGKKVKGLKPSAGQIKTNVDESSMALSRAGRILLKAGVVIRAKKDVPQFSVSESEPGVFVRRLNGKEERGRLVNGKFQVID